MTDPLKILSKTLHDLRNPLSSVIGYGELLEELQETPEAKSYAAIIQRKAREMSELMEAVSDVVYWKRGQPPVLNQKNQDLNLLVLETVEKLKLIYPKTRWNIRGEGSFPCWIDRLKTLKILWNVFKNCCENTGDETSIHLSLSENELYIILEVQDQGPGIPAEILGNLGECFSPGMGLAWSKTLAESQSGSMEILNTPMGARIILAFKKDPAKS